MSGNVCPVASSEGYSFDPPVVESGTMLRTMMDLILDDAYRVMGVGSLRYGKSEMTEMIARCIDRDIEVQERRLSLLPNGATIKTFGADRG